MLSNMHIKEALASDMCRLNIENALLSPAVAFVNKSSHAIVGVKDASNVNDLECTDDHTGIMHKKE